MKNLLNFFVVLMLLFLNCLSIAAQAVGTNPEEGKGSYKNRTFFNLERYWDDAKALNNPHKGWEVHYYSNSVNNYGRGLAPNDSLSDFPGLTNIYLRLAWSYIEPEEGVFNWAVLDSVVNRWVPWGKTVSFRITTKETTITYATPEWVIKAGAKGELFGDPGRRQAWSPDYGDPIFLAKLENFHRAFAARYDKPFTSYVDIGSIGDWGEGHTAQSGWKDVPVDVVKKHIDLHKRCYKNTILIISDDYIGQRDTDDGADYEIFNYCKEKGIGYRDDSANVSWYNRTLGFSNSCIRTPELFSSAYKSIPVVLEQHHYRDLLRTYPNNTRDIAFEMAVRETKATMIGFHHYPREWLNHNYRFAIKMANLSGYWYFPKFAMLPDTLRTNSNRNYIRMTWENRGVAPAYNKYDFSIRLVNKETGSQFTQTLEGSDNRKWMPNEFVAEHCIINLDKNLKEGKYDLLINLRNTTEFNKNKNIELPIRNEREVAPGWYKLGEIWVK